MDTRYKITRDGDGCNGFPSGAHYRLDDPVVQAFIAEGGALEPAITEAELKAAHNASIKSQIAALEEGQGRAIREATLTGDHTRLQAIEDKIAAIRKEMQ